MPRLLIVKTSSLGDVVHNLPVVSDIHAYRPDIEIDWVVEENFADIPALHPDVSKIIPVAVRRWRRAPFSIATWREMSVLRNNLAEYRYDYVLDTQGLLKSAVIASCARGQRHGQGAGSAREPLAALFYHHQHRIPRGQHAVTRNRQLAALALGYPMPSSSPNYGIRAPDSLLSPDLPKDFVVGLHATSRDSKLWPVDRWIALGRVLADSGLNLVMPWGNSKERARAEMIAATLTGAVVLPLLRLTELASVMSKAKAVVGVDTGLIHLAAALNLPTVAIYTETNPLMTGVMGLDSSRHINLGGIGQKPGNGDVLDALRQVAKI